MKKLLNSLLALSLVATFACKEDDPTPKPEESNLVELSGNLSTQTLDATKRYLLKGQVFVNDGMTLTVPAGTVVMGDKASKGTLVIGLGGKLMAEGTASNPIVFTSKLGVGERDKGDWGGIVILGKANVNQNGPKIEGISPAVEYGTFNSTANNADNSGVLKYVRIEFAGIALSPNNETNSLTMGAVGSGTTIENVQVSFGGDDGFEWFGGVVNAKNLISFGTWDDDFDTDFGYQGNVQNAVVIRDPFSADQSGSNAFESDNNGNGDAATPLTNCVFSNVTVFGPRSDSTTSISGNYQNAMHLKKNTSISIFNSILTGYATGLNLDGTAAQANYTAGTAVLANNVLAMTKLKSSSADPVFYANAASNTYWNTAGNDNVSVTIVTSPAKVADWTKVGLSEALFFAENSTYPANPNLAQVTPTGTIPGADFTHTKLSGAFFTSTSHIGAFGATDWTDGWSNFDPKNAAY